MLNELEEIQKKGFVENLRKSYESSLQQKNEEEQSFLEKLET